MGPLQQVQGKGDVSVVQNVELCVSFPRLCPEAVDFHHHHPHRLSDRCQELIGLTSLWLVNLGHRLKCEVAVPPRA
jgi:hypothetical protein